MWGNREIGAVIYRRTRTYYSRFTYTPAFTDSLVLVHSKRTNEALVAEVNNFSYPYYYTKCLSST